MTRRKVVTGLPIKAGFEEEAEARPRPRELIFGT